MNKKVIAIFFSIFSISSGFCPPPNGRRVSFQEEAPALAPADSTTSCGTAENPSEFSTPDNGSFGSSDCCGAPGFECPRLEAFLAGQDVQATPGRWVVEQFCCRKERPQDFVGQVRFDAFRLFLALTMPDLPIEPCFDCGLVPSTELVGFLTPRKPNPDLWDMDPEEADAILCWQKSPGIGRGVEFDFPGKRDLKFRKKHNCFYFGLEKYHLTFFCVAFAWLANAMQYEEFLKIPKIYMDGVVAAIHRTAGALPRLYPFQLEPNSEEGVWAVAFSMNFALGNERLMSLLGFNNPPMGGGGYQACEPQSGPVVPATPKGLTRAGRVDDFSELVGAFEL